MIIDRKVERYVSEVVAFLPPRVRGEAAHEITGMLLDLVKDHAGDEEPDILDARAVLDELGDPEIMAMSWMEAMEDSESGYAEEPGIGYSGLLAGRGSLTYSRINRILSVMLTTFTVLGVLFTGFGIVALSVHLINTMLPIFLGCVMALLSVAGRSVMIRQTWAKLDS